MNIDNTNQYDSGLPKKGVRAKEIRRFVTA